MYFLAPISLAILEAYPRKRRLCSVLGLVIAVASLVAASFATEVWHLVLLQGVAYAIGGSMLYSPTVGYLDEWFVRRKGVAFGVIFAGVGAYVHLSLILFSVFKKQTANTHTDQASSSPSS
jgi:MFS family permease